MLRIDMCNTIVCSEIYDNQDNVVFYSPQHPGVYSAHHNCLWKIKSDKPRFFNLTITDFDLNYSPRCTVDYLKITDRNKELNLKRLCGVHQKIMIVFRTSELTIHFKSKARGGTGFNVIYQKVKNQRRFIQIDNNEVMRG